MNSTGQKIERLRSAWALLAERAGSTGGCPSLETLWAGVRGELSQRKMRKLGLHTISCPACAEAWRLAREMSSEVPPETVAAQETSPSRVWLAWGSLAAAAAIVVIVVTLAPIGKNPDLRDPVFRTIEEEPIGSLLPMGKPIPRERCVLRWVGPDRARYEIRVATANLEILAEVQNLTATEYQVPNEVLQTLPSGARLFWQVKAVLPGGQRLTSRTFVSILE